MKRLFRWQAWMLALSLVVSAAPAARGQAEQTPPPTAQPAQEYCPVTTDEKIDPDIHAEYQGRTVYFCCERCKKKFEREPDKYTVNLASFQSPASPPTATPSPPAGRTDHDPAPESPSPAAHEDRPEKPGHEHEHPDGGGGAARWLKWLGNFHPPMVNFPIGVLVAAALAELLFIRTKNAAFSQAARYGVAFACLTGVAAAALGWCFGGFRLFDSDPILLTHRWLGTGAALWMPLLLWASGRSRREGAPQGLYRALLFGGAGLVLATGFFGGAMVYGLDHYLP